MTAKRTKPPTPIDCPDCGRTHPARPNPLAHLDKAAPRYVSSVMKKPGSTHIGQDIVCAHCHRPWSAHPPDECPVHHFYGCDPNWCSESRREHSFACFLNGHATHYLMRLARFDANGWPVTDEEREWIHRNATRDRDLAHRLNYPYLYYDDVPEAEQKADMRRLCEEAVEESRNDPCPRHPEEVQH